jgi:hypothetical protein
MVTGIETAGLVLASIPLLISALEHYKEGLHPIKVFFRKPYELGRFYRALDEQKTFLRLSLVELFGQHLERLSPDQIEALQDDTDDLAILWSDKILQRSVEETLGLAYVPYMNNIEKMKAALEKLVNQKCLYLETVAKVSRRKDVLEHPRFGHSSRAHRARLTGITRQIGAQSTRLST